MLKGLSKEKMALLELPVWRQAKKPLELTAPEFHYHARPKLLYAYKRSLNNLNIEH